MHDPAYKSLFFHPRMVEDLVSGFVPAPIAGSLDLSTLEKLPAEFISDDLQRRYSDCLWRVRRRGHWLYVVAMLEFQSGMDTHMAVRVMSYTGLLYEDLIRRKKLVKGWLPPVLPVVLYNGRRRWTAERDVKALVIPMDEGLPEHPESYLPSCRYLLIDVGRVEVEDLPERNLVSALIRLETSRAPKDMVGALEVLEECVSEPPGEGLKRAFEEWIGRVLLPRKGFEAGERVPRLSEVKTMLEDRVKEWVAPWVQEGREQGIEQGIVEGIERGQTELLRRLAVRKFGASSTERFSEMLVGIGDAGQLAEIGDWLIECETSAELLDRVANLESRGSGARSGPRRYE